MLIRVLILSAMLKPSEDSYTKDHPGVLRYYHVYFDIAYVFFCFIFLVAAAAIVEHPQECYLRKIHTGASPYLRNVVLADVCISMIVIASFALQRSYMHHHKPNYDLVQYDSTLDRCVIGVVILLFLLMKLIIMGVLSDSNHCQSEGEKYTSSAIDGAATAWLVFHLIFVIVLVVVYIEYAFGFSTWYQRFGCYRGEDEQGYTFDKVLMLVRIHKDDDPGPPLTRKGACTWFRLRNNAYDKWLVKHNPNCKGDKCVNNATAFTNKKGYTVSSKLNDEIVDYREGDPGQPMTLEAAEYLQRMRLDADTEWAELFKQKQFQNQQRQQISYQIQNKIAPLTTTNPVVFVKQTPQVPQQNQFETNSNSNYLNMPTNQPEQQSNRRLLPPLKNGTNTQQPEARTLYSANANAIHPMTRSNRDQF